jgi:hypothetical protein
VTLDEELLRAARTAGAASAAAQEQAGSAKMSHQRVHQIVEQAKRTERCWFCGRAADEAGDCSFCSESRPVHECAEAKICRCCLDLGAAVISGAASPR